MKKRAVITFLFLLFASIVYAGNNDWDTTKIKNKKNIMFFWLRQPISLLPTNGVNGHYEINEKGLSFFPIPKPLNPPYLISYEYAFKEIFIDWKDIVKIKRRASFILAPYMKNMLFIKLKDGKRYFFMCNHKKEIIKAYKTYMNMIGK